MVLNMKVVSKVVGNFAYKNVPTPVVGETVELKPCEQGRLTNHIGVFKDGQQVGSVANRVGRNMVNNEDLIEVIGEKCVFTISKRVLNIKGSFEFIIEGDVDMPEKVLTIEEAWAKKNWSRGKAFYEFGEQRVAGKQQFLGDGEIIVTLGGVDINKFSQTPQFDWVYEADGMRKWGFNSQDLFEALAKIGANSGDKVSIRNVDKQWVVKKV